MKMGKIKEKIEKLYQEKRSKLGVFYSIKVIQNFKEGEKFAKIPGLVNIKTNQESYFDIEKGKIYLINYFSALFDENDKIKEQYDLLMKNKENS